MKRSVCVVTGTRAEYGLLRWVMEGIRTRSDLKLQIVATGMHLSPEFGLTYRDIEHDGFRIDRRVETLLSSDTAVGVAKSMGLGLLGFADALAELRPDILVVLGDRFETFSAAAAAMVARIPIAHIHGGETTEGAIDEPIRHSITKMSQFHFVAADAYRRRVIQLGEDPATVFLVGSLGVDSVKKLPLLDHTALEASLGVRMAERNLLITFHPVTLEDGTSETQMAELLAVLATLRETRLIFTLPNADTDGRILATQVRAFVAGHDNARVYTSLGQLRYLSCMQFVDGVIGNSSSGIIEAPSLGAGTVNIGDRQRGRVKAGSVIDCAPTRESIDAAITRLYSPDFRDSLRTATNPYGQGGAAEQIVELLAMVKLEGSVKKRFHDIVPA